MHWIGWPDFQQAKALLTGCKLDRTKFKIHNSFSAKQYFTCKFVHTTFFVLVHLKHFEMSFVCELIDENIQKEMAEAVRDLEANVSNISV